MEFLEQERIPLQKCSTSCQHLYEGSVPLVPGHLYETVITSWCWYRSFQPSATQMNASDFLKGYRQLPSHLKSQLLPPVVHKASGSSEDLRLAFASQPVSK